MRAHPILISVTALALAVGACDKSGPTGSNQEPVLGRSTSADTSANGGGNNNPPPPPPPDSGGTRPGGGGSSNPPPPPPDTGSTYRGTVRLTVTAVAVERNSQQGGNDTLSVTPVANARVEVQGILQLTQSAQAGTTDSNGEFVVSDLPVGPYVIKVIPPSGSGFSTAAVNVVLNQAVAGVRVSLFH